MAKNSFRFARRISPFFFPFFFFFDFYIIFAINLSAQITTLDARAARFYIYTRRIRKSVTQECWLLLLRKNNGYGYRPYSRTLVVRCFTASLPHEEFVCFFVCHDCLSISRPRLREFFLRSRCLSARQKFCNRREKYNDCKASSLTSSARRSDFNYSLLE